MLLGEIANANASHERAGVVDQDVDRPELGRRSLDEAVDVFCAANVGCYRDRGPARRHDPIASLLGSALVAMVANGDARAEVGQRLCGSGADARRGARDECDFGRETEVRFHDPNLIA
jgi:hypothetical protein